MSNEAVALTGFVSLFVLMLLRVPVGMAMGLVGITGFGYLTGFAPALKLVGQTTMRTVTCYSFGVLPMFLLLGAGVGVAVVHMVAMGGMGVGWPGSVSVGRRASWRERLVALRDGWSPLLLCVLVTGGLDGGFLIPAGAGAVGAVGAFIIGVLRG